MFGCVLIFLLFFHAKSVTTNNDRTELSDISYLSSFGHDSNHINKFPKSFPSVEKKPV